MDTPVSSINETDRHDITEILLKDGVNHHGTFLIQSCTENVHVHILVSSVYHTRIIGVFECLFWLNQSSRVLD